MDSPDYEMLARENAALREHVTALRGVLARSARMYSSALDRIDARDREIRTLRAELQLANGGRPIDLAFVMAAMLP